MNTCSSCDCHQLDGLVEDLVTFLSGVLVRRLQIGVYGLKIAI